MVKFQMLFLTNYLILVILMLISVAFLTLMERKILGFMQIRIGPNKVGSYGLLQPFSDAVKLYTKEYNKPSFSNKFMFFLFPSLGLSISLMLWMIMPFFKSVFFIKFSLILFMMVLSVGVYTIMFMGWSSNSNYSHIGGIRSVAQTISYEVSLTFLLMTPLFMSKNLNLFYLIKQQAYTWNALLIPVFIMWLISMLAELNRTPFDLAEAESELVSGFNTEFSGGKFAIIFMAEYMMIIIFSNLTAVLFLGSKISSIEFFLFSSTVMMFIIWMRATLPRIRYDKLMSLTWKMFLPSVMMMLMSVISLTIMFA